LFSKDESEATLTTLVDFGKNSPSTKVFVIKQSDYDQAKQKAETEKVNINEVQKQISVNDSEEKKKQFWSKLNDLTDIKNARLWSINLSGKKCSALVVNTLSPLKTIIARLIEEDCINAFKTYILASIVPKMSPPGKRRRCNYPAFDDTADSTFTVHDSQSRIADQCCRMITLKLQKMAQSADSLKYDGVRCILLLPDRISIASQTNERLAKSAEYYMEKFSLEKVNIVIARINDSREMTGKWKEFIESAKRNPNSLHLVVHDECHWAAGKGQISHKFLGFENGDYHRDDSGDHMKNLFTLMVSATPFNFFTSNYLKDEDILDWKKHIPENENKYQGLTALRKNKKIKSGDTNKKIHDNFLIQTFNGFTEEFLGVISDYAEAICEYGTSDETFLPKSETIQSFVKESVKACIDQSKLIVIRVASAKEDIRQTEVAKQILKDAIRSNTHLCRDNESMVEVLVNSPTDKDEDSINMSKVNQQIALQNIRKRLGKENISDLKELQFSDVNGIPMIMLIIEQGRMGDTFPPNCVCFDLRARFLGPVKDFTSIIQDVGRAFGYGDRPGVNFINILSAPFSNISIFQRFSLITVWICNFLAKEYWNKSCF